MEAGETKKLVRWFGTYREHLDGNSKTYKGKGEHVDDKKARIHDAKASLFGAPSRDTVLYYSLLLPIVLFVLKTIQGRNREFLNKNPFLFLRAGS